MPSTSSRVVMDASFGKVSKLFSNQGVKSSPIQKMTFDSWIALASDGFNWYSWGEASEGIIKFGFPNPFITFETNEWTGAMSTATLGTSADATPTVSANADVSETNLLDIFIS